MMSFDGKVRVQDTAQAGDTDTGSQPVFKRVLVPVEDASQMEQVVELARRAGASEARVLHLNLRESIRGQRFAIETESSASGVVETAVLELGMAGIAASGHVRYALVDRAAEAIVADATEWGADLIVLGSPRRSELATRLFGIETLRVLRHAPCPVLVASPAGKDRLHRAEEESAASVTVPDPHVQPAGGRSDNLTSAPAR